MMNGIVPVLIALLIGTPLAAVLYVELRRYERDRQMRFHRQRLEAFIKQRQKDKLL